MEALMGQILSFGGNFAPRGWFTCSGQLLAISTNTALFSILGTTYGGNGQSTFALPDLRGRRIIGWGSGAPGLDTYDLGEEGGRENVQLLTSNLPMHNHIISLQCDAENAGESSPEAHYMGTSSSNSYSANAGAAMAVQIAAASITGGSQPFQSLTPYLVMTQCICSEGYYPARN